ncbi:hypothetical protein RC083_17190 [Pseudoalteromonas haloplanktis]|uniref:Membrane protein triplicated sequence n=1 Tax=Pseudoalteromonas haloplanktis TaxID=228 RepID=A0ABU1BHT4_PSEHA|nr:hypothetical protein [Pseudoalteromonas haloplanktis]MDQ9093316.1 hypothetical protein [Pseudoalteromonas haloplanktis]
MSTFILWGFLMTFLYCLVQKSFMPNGDRTLMWISLTIFLSYLLFDPLLNKTLGIDSIDYTNVYLIFSACDIFTLIIILLITYKKKVSELPAKLYVVAGLTVNIVLFIGMHIDTIILSNHEAWWFWSFYSVAVNLMDIMMITALVLNKDYLGLMRLLRKVGLLKA